MKKRVTIPVSGAILAAALLIYYPFLSPDDRLATEDAPPVEEQPVQMPFPVAEPVPTLDTEAYDLKMRQLANVTEEALPEGSDSLWPAEAVYPEVGALLPFNRIVAYYGNFYSTRMGILGQYAPDEVIRRLAEEVESWEKADPTTPVVPAIDYIAVVAQRGAGADGKYRFRMPDSQIQKALDMAERVDGIVILEVQAGLSAVMTEVRQLEPYLSLENVHLAIDPEFAMVPSGRRPGTVVGTVDAEDVNAAAEYLATLVREHGLPPKVLIVHRYTRSMVTNADDIAPLPEVQVVMDMDGWGPPAQKRNTYQAFIHSEPVQFTGFKLFYRNDRLRPGSRLLTPAEILELTPRPSFIQYQ